MQAFCSAIRPVRNHDGVWQVAVLGDAWQTVVLGDGTTPAAMPDSDWTPSACIDFWGESYFLLLAHPGGHRVTWVLDEGLRALCDLDDPVLDEIPGMRQTLSGPATVLRRALRSRLVFRPDETLGTALRGMNARGLARFLRMAESRRARSLALGTFSGTLSLPTTGGSAAVSPDALAQILDLQEGWLVPALEAGRIQVPAISANGPADAVFLVGRTGAAPILLCAERGTGLSYYLVCRDGAPPALYFHDDNLFVSRDALDAPAVRGLLDALDASLASIASALAAMDVSLLPDRTEGLGVLVSGAPDDRLDGGDLSSGDLSSGDRGSVGEAVQEVDAIAVALQALPAGHQPPTLYLAAPASVLDRIGPAEELFPEFAGRAVRSGSEAAALAHAIASGTEVILLAGRRSSPAARTRIKDFLERASCSEGLADQVRAACRRDGQPRLVVTLGIPLSDRRIADLLGFYGRLARALADRFAPVVFLLDGSTEAAAAAPGAAGGIRPAEGKAWVAAFREMLGALEAEVVDCTGLPARDRLQWLRHSRFFVAPLGGGLRELRWALDIPGLVLLEDEAARDGEDPLRPYTDEALLGGPAAALHSSRMDRVRLAPDVQGAGSGKRGRAQPQAPVLHEDGLTQRVGDLVAAQVTGTGIAVQELPPAALRQRKARRGLLGLLARRPRATIPAAPKRPADAGPAHLASLPPVPRGPGLRCIEVTKDYPTHHGRRRVLDGVSFELERGQKLAVLGRNGAGKSTLIRMVGGVDFPTSGRIERDMTVSWPLGFSGAFQGSLSGIDNLRFICRIYGLDYDDTRLFVDDFAELGSQLGEPVKNYSSGMRARLAFALSIAIEFECYLIDEVIMVGDKRFTDRCRQELFDKRADRSLILVSHDLNIVKEVCSTAAVIHDRRLHMCDSVADAVSYYERM